MGISISKTNPIPSASVILDDEFDSFNQQPYTSEERTPTPQPTPTPEVVPEIYEPEAKVETDPIKICYSEEFNYRIKSWIYERLHTYTEGKKTLRPIASAAIATSTLSDLILRTSSVGEIALYALGLSLLSPFSRDYKESLYDAYDWVSKVPYKVGSIVTLPIEVVINSIFMLVDPRYFIIKKAECAKVQKKHLEKRTLGSKAYKRDLHIASGRAYALLLDFQRANEKHQ